MRVLVLGASGFLGSNLCAALVGQGAKVRGLARSLKYPEPLRSVDFIERELKPGMPMEALLSDIEVVFNLIGSPSLQVAEQDRMADLNLTVGGMWALLDACLSAGVKRVVFASSGGAVYGPQQAAPITETATPRPISSYGLHKLAAEHCLAVHNKQHGTKNVSLRISNAYGPYQHGKRGNGIVSIFAQRILTDQPITIMGDGSVRRDFVYVEDVCDAFVAASRYEGQEDVFNIGTGQTHSVLDVLHALQSALGRDAEICHGTARSFDLPLNILDTTSAATNLGWQSQTAWQAGIAKTVDWLKSQSQAGFKPTTGTTSRDWTAPNAEQCGTKGTAGRP